MDNQDNYENDYRVAMEEVRRLRGVVRNFGEFYKKIEEAVEKRDWELVETALKEYE